jgi:hypothetical protein
MNWKETCCAHRMTWWWSLWNRPEWSKSHWSGHVFFSPRGRPLGSHRAPISIHIRIRRCVWAWDRGWPSSLMCRNHAWLQWRRPEYCGRFIMSASSRASLCSVTCSSCSSFAHPSSYKSPHLSLSPSHYAPSRVLHARALPILARTNPHISVSLQVTMLRHVFFMLELCPS